MSKHSTVTKTLLAGVIGVGAGLLLAPKSGKETRSDMKKKLQTSKAKLAKDTGAAKQAAQDVANGATAKSREAVTIVADTAGEIASDLKAGVDRIVATAKK